MHNKIPKQILLYNPKGRMKIEDQRKDGQIKEYKMDHKDQSFKKKKKKRALQQY